MRPPQVIHLAMICLTMACNTSTPTTEAASVATATEPSIPQTAPRKLTDDATYTIGEWPRFPQKLAEGEGRELTEAVCSACHSTTYILGQPPLEQATWAAEVHKMIEAYGAAVPPGGEAKIVAYLTAQYGPTRRQETKPPLDTTQGQRIYAGNCVPCHQLTGTGLPGAFPPLAGHVPELLETEAGRQYLPRVVLYGLTGEIKVNGTSYNNMMTPFGHLSDTDLAAVLNYVANAWGNDKALHDFKPFTAEDLAAARKAAQTPQTTRTSRP